MDLKYRKWANVMFEQNLIIFLMKSFPIWLLIRLLILVKKDVELKAYEEWLRHVFALYLLIVTYLTLQPFAFQIPFVGGRAFSFDHQLFYQLFRMADGYLHLQVLYSIGNILMFIPFGMLAPFIFKKLRQFNWLFLASFLFSLSIELTQGLFTMSRRATVDDLVLNTAGAIVGYIMFRLINNYDTTCKLIEFSDK